jgi:hypothetical protein
MVSRSMFHLRGAAEQPGGKPWGVPATCRRDATTSELRLLAWRKTSGAEIGSSPGIEPDAVAIAQDDQPIAYMLALVDPLQRGQSQNVSNLRVRFH